MTDWTTISSLATAGGTLVLAAATFAAVRSANRAARNAERALFVGLRPVLFSSRLDDPLQKIRWVDDHWATLGGGRAVLEDVDGVIYMAMSLRNVASGIAVLHGWRVDLTQVLNPNATFELSALRHRPGTAAKPAELVPRLPLTGPGSSAGRGRGATQ